MSALSEASDEHITLGDLRERYGLKGFQSHVDPVTITSVANTVEEVTPGALFLLDYDSATVNYGDAFSLINQASLHGAYAAVISMHDSTQLRNDQASGGQASAVQSSVDQTSDDRILMQCDIPVFTADLSKEDIGHISADLAGQPSDSLAIFAVCGVHAQKSVEVLGQLLHMLGNPVGIISFAGSRSVDQPIEISYPLNAIDVQKLLAGMLEDGATSVVLSIDDETFDESSLTSISIDVLGLVSEKLSKGNNYEIDERADTLTSYLGNRAKIQRILKKYGTAVDNNTHYTEVTEESRQIVESDLENLESMGESIHGSAATEYDVDTVAICVAMVMQAGVKKNSIKSALRLSQELTARELK